MKRIAILFLTGIMLLSATACGDEKEMSLGSGEEAQVQEESYPVVRDDYFVDGRNMNPEYFAKQLAPEAYEHAYSPEYDSDSKEVISDGNFQYNVYDKDDGSGKIAFCIEYVGPTENLTEIVIPGQVNDIPVHGVVLPKVPYSVTSIIIEEGVENMENSFWHLPNLSHVELPDSLIRIFESFIDLPALETIELPSSLYWLQGFHQCENFSEVVIPESVGYIQGFDYCDLVSVTIEGTGLYCLDYNSFRDSTSLTEVLLPDSVRAIAAGCFMNTAILEFHIPACLQGIAQLGDFNKTNINERILQNTPFMSAQTGDYIIWHENYLVAYLGNETSVTIPEGITHVCSHAFANNQTVQEIIVPEGVEYFHEYALWGNTSLKKLELPKSLVYFDVSYSFKETASPEFVAVIPEGSIAKEEFESGKLKYEFK